MKRWVIVVICVAVVLCLVGTVTGVSLAIWKEEKDKDVSIGLTPEINPSLRFQIFAPIDASNNVITFESYNQEKHGEINYSTSTDKGYLLFVKSGKEYVLAKPKMVAEGTGLFVRSGYEDFDTTGVKHGNRLYDTLTSNNRPLYAKQVTGDSVQYVQTIPVTTPLDQLYVYDETSVGYIQYNESTHGRLTARNTTSTNYRLFVEKNGKHEYASSSDIIAGNGLKVYEYSEFTDDLSSDYGSRYLDSKTSSGYYLYVKSGKDYVLAEAEQVNLGAELFAGGAINSYALVGYTGIVAEVIVPSTYTSASGKRYTVTRICSSSEYANVAFTGNPIITTLVIPDTIQSIADGTFANMSALNTVYFKGSGNIRLGQYCFMSCSKLKNVYVDSDIKLLDTSDNPVTPNGENEVFFGCTELGK